MKFESKDKERSETNCYLKFTRPETGQTFPAIWETFPCKKIVSLCYVPTDGPAPLSVITVYLPLQPLLPSLIHHPPPDEKSDFTAEP